MRPSLIAILLAASVSAPCALAAQSRQSSPYAGIGATIAAFRAGHAHAKAHYAIDATRGGRVVAEHVTITGSPRFDARLRIILIIGDLPADSLPTNLRTNTCEVWESRILVRLIGMRYIAATTRPGTNTAQMRAETQPHC